MNARLRSLLVAGGMVLVGGALAASDDTGSAPRNPERFTLQEFTALGAGSDVLALKMPGYPESPRHQVLHNPERVVFDFPGVLKGDAVNRAALAGLKGTLIKKVRVAQYATSPELITRVVLEVEKGTVIRYASTGDLRTLSAEKSGGETSIALQGTTPVLAEAAPAVQVAAAPSPVPTPVVESAAAPVMESLPVVAETRATAAPSVPLPSIGAPYSPIPALALATPGTVAAPAVQVPSPHQGSKPQGTKTLGDYGQRYTGTPLSIDVQGADLGAFLRILAEHGKVNLIIDPDVTGNYTFNFKETPWDQILDIVLKHAGLGKELSNGVLRVAKVERLQKEEEDRKKLEEAKALAGDLQSITRGLSYAKVTDVTKVLEKVISKRGSLITDERTNTIIVSDLPQKIAVIEDLLAQLDVQIQQVQIEARVVEASKGYEKNLGVLWPNNASGQANINASVPNGTGGSTYGPVPWVSSGGSPSWNSVNNRPSAGGNVVTAGGHGSMGISNPAGEFWVSFLSNRLSLNVILQALEKDGIVKIVSQPKLVTQNNKKGTILAGEKIPYPTIQGGAQGGAITVAFVEANLQLDVTPQITNEGTIIMDIKVEKAEADFSRQVQGTPTVLRKMVETQVLVKDGGTAILGGVYTTNTNTGQTGIPFLSKLPLLGWLFRSKTNNEKSAELLVFITPRIIKS